MFGFVVFRVYGVLFVVELFVVRVDFFVCFVLCCCVVVCVGLCCCV